MGTRLRILDFLCKLQVLIGALVIAGAIGFLIVSIAVANEPGAPPTPILAQWTVAEIVAGGIFLGLSIIATAQVYQCLMQIEINTRPAATATPSSSHEVGRAQEPLVPAPAPAILGPARSRRAS